MSEADVVVGDEPPADDHSDLPWQRLDTRVVWVDLAKTVVSLIPGGIAIGLFDAELNRATMIPMLIIGGMGVIGGVSDLLRWIKTRYRITDQYVERRTGFFVRKHRSVRRERIRSVDTSARLRHRLTGLRVVTVGAGQQHAAGEAALVLDAVRADVAERLRTDLLRRSRVAATPAGAEPVADGADTYAQPDAAPSADDGRVLARLRPSWVVYNIFTIWAYFLAAGVLWGAYWVAQMFGLDLADVVRGMADWEELGTGWTIVVALAAVGAFGVLGLAAKFFSENWRFTLTRVQTDGGSLLRTTQGLLKTREVNRDDERLRGAQIAEPLLWRWMGMADTSVISTGLTIWSVTPSSTILPRGPVTVARRVVAEVLDTDTSPLDVPLRPHPRHALRRRVSWALTTVTAITGLLAWLTTLIGALPDQLWLAGPALLPVALGLAVVAFRSLGHTVVDGSFVTRSGAMSRTTAALESRAAVGVTFRQSLLQRRLSLATVETPTAAGMGAYTALDVHTADAVALADRAVPGLLTPFLTGPDQRGGMP